MNEMSEQQYLFWKKLDNFLWQNLEKEPDVFADIFNALLFNEEKFKITDAKSTLSDIPTEGIYTDLDENMQNIFHDAFKEYTSIEKSKIYLAYIGVANQEPIKRFLPVWSMGYAYAGYKKQADDYYHQQNELQKLYENAKNETAKEAYKAELSKLGEFKTFPVISVVLNFSRKDWSQPKSIVELEDNNNPYIHYAANHQMLVFDVHKFDEKTRAKFTSDFRIFVELFCTGKIPKELEELEINHPTKLVDMLITYGVNADNLQKIRDNISIKELNGERIDMRTILAEAKKCI